MKLGREARLQGVLCGVAVVLCDLVSWPFTTMGVCDDGPYIRMARTFASTGHLVYNGWGAAMMTSQLCIAAIFIKLFGSSATSVRMSTLLLAAITAFVFHRTLIRTGCSARNATLGTLAVVLSPLYLMLSPTFMTDIDGVFATTLCLYGCIRALQASRDRSAIAWIFFAVITCAFFGTSRQIAWLGNLVMVPSALWLLRSRRRVLLAGSLATVFALLVIIGCTHWLSRQPYSVPLPLIPSSIAKRLALRQLSYILLEIPFLVLPVIAAFIPRIFRSRPAVIIASLAGVFAYVALAVHSRACPDPLIHFEPAAGYGGSWFTSAGAYTTVAGAPTLLHTNALIVLTILCLAGLLGAILVAVDRVEAKTLPSMPVAELSWQQLVVLLLPFSLAYLLLLLAALGTTLTLFDRYALGLCGPGVIVLIRLYQERVRRSLPLATVLLIVMMAALGVIATHNTFAIDRARVELGNELHAAGVPYTAIDGGWDYNFDTELDHASYINNPLVKVPVGAYVATAPPPPGDCRAWWWNETPHVHALYGMSFLPAVCYGKAPFAAVAYRAWPFGARVQLYAVRYAPPGSAE